MIPAEEAKKTKRLRNEPKLPAHVALEAPFRHQYVHQPGLPPSATPGVSAFDALFKANRPDLHGAVHHAAHLYRIESPGPDFGQDSDPEDGITVRVKVDGTSRHYRRRVAQHHTWRDIVIPDLVKLYLRQKYGGPAHVVAPCFCRARALSVELLDWNSAFRFQLRTT